MESRNIDSGTILILILISDYLGPIHLRLEMPAKRNHSASGSDSLSPPPVEPKAKKSKSGMKPKRSLSSGEAAPSDEFQQITKPDFVDRYRVTGAQDVYYQPEVGILELFLILKLVH